MWTSVSPCSRAPAQGGQGVLLPFDRAVGTALVYAFLDMKNIVGHAEVRPGRCCSPRH